MTEPLTKLEITFSRPMEIPVQLPEGFQGSTPVTWNMIDESSHRYAKLLQEYDIAEVLKTILETFHKTKEILVLPKPGNLDLDDTYVNFHDFIAQLEKMKQKKRMFKKEKDLQTLRQLAQPTLDYLMTGKHSNKDKVFSGWKSSLMRTKKPLIYGILSVDIPTPKEDRYVCGGTQHYISFVFNIPLKTVYLFDSASKHPDKEHSEAYYVLKFFFESMYKEPIHVQGMSFSSILQPGAGEKTEEDEHSYHNQNVFCHTWSLWFLSVFTLFYKLENPEESIKTLSKLSHRDSLLNLAMIKRFAKWMLTFIQEEIPPKPSKFGKRGYEKAINENNQKRLHELAFIYLDYHEPLVGLDYIYSYKNKKFISVQELFKKKKVKLDIFALQQI